MSEAPSIVQKVAAEVIGTFFLVFLGCGSVVLFGAASSEAAGPGLPTTITAVGLTFGLTVTVMAYAFGRISGGHFNPAVTLGAAFGGRLAWREVGIYIGSQFAGAILGALTLFVIAKGFDGWSAEGAMGQNAFGDQSAAGFAWWAAILLELLLTMAFIWVILAVTDVRNEHPALAPLAIGLTLAVIHFVAIPATGTSVNPARSFGPALFAGGDAFVQSLLFVVVTAIGGALGGITYPAIFGHGDDPVPGSGMTFAPRGAGRDQYQQEWNQQQTAPHPQAGYDQHSYGQPGQQQYGQDAYQQQWNQEGHAGQHQQYGNPQATQQVPTQQPQQPGQPGQGYDSYGQPQQGAPQGYDQQNRPWDQSRNPEGWDEGGQTQIRGNDPR